MEDVLTYVGRNQERYLAQLAELIAIPSVSTETSKAVEMHRCAEWLVRHLRHLGLDAHVFATPGHPIVHAEYLAQSNAPILLLYGHYDVQPAGSPELWDSPPFQATVRDGRLYARGSTDDKGQFFIHLKAAEAWLKTTGRLPVNLKIVLEGEEEIGSTNLASFLTEHKERLACGVAVISDTAFFADGVPSICYGLRGIVYMQVDIEGPNRDLHSGSFGGSVQNPTHVLAELIARLQDKRGAVSIPGFYDDVVPLSAEEQVAFEELPWSDEAFARDLGVDELFGEEGFGTLERLWARPTLDCNGIIGGFTSEGVMSIIPARASAKISMRLVPNQDPEKIASLFEQHIRSLAPRSVRVAVKRLSAAEPAITPLDSPGIRAALAALEKAFGKKPLLQRDGGSIPVITRLKKILGADTVLLGFGLPDENAHGPNEFLKLENFYGGIRTVVHFYKELSSYAQKNEESRSFNRPVQEARGQD